MSTGAEALQTGSNTAGQFFPRDDQLKLDTEKIAGEALPEDFAGDPVVSFLFKKRQLAAQNILKKEYEAAAAYSLQVKPETKPAPADYGAVELPGGIKAISLPNRVEVGEPETAFARLAGTSREKLEKTETIYVDTDFMETPGAKDIQVHANGRLIVTQAVLDDIDQITSANGARLFVIDDQMKAQLDQILVPRSIVAAAAAKVASRFKGKEISYKGQGVQPIFLTDAEKRERQLAIVPAKQILPYEETVYVLVEKIDSGYSYQSHWTDKDNQTTFHIGNDRYEIKTETNRGMHFSQPMYTEPVESRFETTKGEAGKKQWITRIYHPSERSWRRPDDNPEADILRTPNVEGVSVRGRSHGVDGKNQDRYLVIERANQQDPKLRTINFLLLDGVSSAYLSDAGVARVVADREVQDLLAKGWLQGAINRANTILNSLNFARTDSNGFERWLQEFTTKNPQFKIDDLRRGNLESSIQATALCGSVTVNDKRAKASILTVGDTKGYKYPGKGNSKLDQITKDSIFDQERPDQPVTLGARSFLQGYREKDKIYEPIKYTEVDLPLSGGEMLVVSTDGLDKGAEAQKPLKDLERQLEDGGTSFADAALRVAAQDYGIDPKGKTNRQLLSALNDESQWGEGGDEYLWDDMTVLGIHLTP
ncbi:hypothetical protein A2966_05060 [Candidatus Roizmanbacteria bacterium RIFCSPLOWO2_01_FULL_41_22]|uniref:PPM-type phosphatase domain-containing protein n=1 Tax=Candidatus Roizmanbacteria bacterium RIFCSPLOWO2_01_FULL_41_22 TaxID=1802067 RepID=A0A1F7J7U1_9BACT|nr:MAG: hypothetical protein A2966_05060 [Candidatus Roizmanbacteria bacterium RIFCSPLOWO2_01_FULL_41_22]